jgi:hypothetical protein
MTIEKTIQGIRISDMIAYNGALGYPVGGHLFTRHYIGYTKKQAMAKFAQEYINESYTK